MPRTIIVLIIGFIVLGAVIRGRAIWDSPVRRPAALLETRDRVRQFVYAGEDVSLHKTSTLEAAAEPQLQSLVDQQVTRIEFQRFDPEAVVVMRAGPDGQPGVARIDDDRNQIIDDPSELGATYSDDVCLVESRHEQDDKSLVLQSGAFVPTAPGNRQGESVQQMRIVVFGESGENDRWSFLIDGEE